MKRFDSRVSVISTLSWSTRERCFLTLLVLFTSFLNCESAAHSQPAKDASAQGPLIKFNLIVTSDSNKSLDELVPRDVEVLENKQLQRIVAVDIDQRPVDLGILIDASGSFRSLLPTSLDAARLIIVNRGPTDETFIEHFISSDQIFTTHDFTGDTNALLESLKLVWINKGQSAVLDAVYVALNQVAKHNPSSEARRKALVLISDGEDRNSYYDQDKLLKLVHEHGIQIFVLGVTTELDKNRDSIWTSSREKAEKLLKKLAQESGGRVFFPKNKSELAEATLQIIHDLRGQFRVTYQSSNPDLTPNYRKFKVNLSSAAGEKRQVIVAPGIYFRPVPAPKKDSP